MVSDSYQHKKKKKKKNEVNFKQHTGKQVVKVKARWLTLPVRRKQTSKQL